jgi:hypothetical protein
VRAPARPLSFYVSWVTVAADVVPTLGEESMAAKGLGKAIGKARGAAKGGKGGGGGGKG